MWFFGGRLESLGHEGEPMMVLEVYKFFELVSRHGFVARWSRAMLMGFRVLSSI